MGIENEIELQATCRLARRMDTKSHHARACFRRCRNDFRSLQPRPSGANRQSTICCAASATSPNRQSTDVASSRDSPNQQSTRCAFPPTPAPETNNPGSCDSSVTVETKRSITVVSAPAPVSSESATNVSNATQAAGGDRLRQTGPGTQPDLYPGFGCDGLFHQQECNSNQSRKATMRPSTRMILRCTGRGTGGFGCEWKICTFVASTLICNIASTTCYCLRASRGLAYGT